ncbi:MAG TPA: mechanosensitive ion channel family protein [Nitrolancea sp.]|nr:mechanosensitive ion channel family protein [Nitrolancea sp.]
MQSFLNALQNAGTDTLHNVGAVVAMIPTFLIAILIVALFVSIAQGLGRGLRRAAKISPHLDPSLRLLIEQLTSALIITFGVAVAFGVVGVSFSTIIATFGVAGLIVGFALKDILENFVAGILILWRRPFEIADQIQVGTSIGTVSEINFRTTTLRTADGIEVLIPNSQVFSQAIQNLTHNGTRRTTIVLQLPVETDLGKAEAMLRGAIIGIDGILDSPAPEILLLGGLPTNYELHLRYWTAPEIQITGRIESSTRKAIAAALIEADLSRTIEQQPAALPGTSNSSATSL